MLEQTGRATICLALLVIVLFAPALGGGFIYDDQVLLVDNPRLIHGTVSSAFTSDYWGFLGRGPWNYLVYRPLAILSFTALQRTFGLSPFALHSTGILFHAAATVSLYLLLLGIGQSAAVSMAAALLFAVHPLHVEAVAWMVGLTETQSDALTLASLACFVHRKPRWSWALAALAVFTKEGAALMPVLVFALAWLCIKPHNWRSAMGAAWPFAAIDAAYFGARLAVLGGPPAGALRTPFAALRIYPAITAQYVKNLFWPWPLTITYDPPSRALVIAVWLGIALYVILAARCRDHALRSDLILCGVLIAVPFSVPILTAPLREPALLVQDRMCYVATTGACLLIAVLLARMPRRVLPVGCLLLATAGAVATHRQIEFWHDEEPFWRHALDVTPDSALASVCLARVMFLEMRFEEARGVLEEAARRNPNEKTVREYLEHLRNGQFPESLPGPKAP